MLRRLIVVAAMTAGAVSAAPPDEATVASTSPQAKAESIEIDRGKSDIDALEFVTYSDGTLAMMDARKRIFRGTFVDEKGEDLLGSGWRKTTIANLARKHFPAPAIRWGASGPSARVHHLLMDPADARAMRIDEAQPELERRRIGLEVHLVNTGIFDKTPALMAQVACDPSPKQRLAAVQRSVIAAGGAAVPQCAASEDKSQQAAFDGLYLLYMAGRMTRPPIVLSGAGEFVAIGDSVDSLIKQVESFEATSAP